MSSNELNLNQFRGSLSMSIDYDYKVHIEAVLTTGDNLNKGLNTVYRVKNLASDLWSFTLEIGRWIQGWRVRHLIFHDQKRDVVRQFLGESCFLSRLTEKLLWKIYVVERQRWLDDVEDGTELFINAHHRNKGRGLNERLRLGFDSLREKAQHACHWLDSRCSGLYWTFREEVKLLKNSLNVDPI